MNRAKKAQKSTYSDPMVEFCCVVTQSGAAVQAMRVACAFVVSARREDVAELSAGTSQVPAQNERHLSPPLPARCRRLSAIYIDLMGPFLFFHFILLQQSAVTSSSSSQ